MPDSDLSKLAHDLGQLIESKQRQYGNSAGRTGDILRVLYPNGIPVHAYDGVLLIARVLDKLSRIAQRGADGRDLGGESPWKDLAGYGILGWGQDEARAGKGAEPEPQPSDGGMCGQCERWFDPRHRDCPRHGQWIHKYDAACGGFVRCSQTATGKGE